MAAQQSSSGHCVMTIRLILKTKLEEKKAASEHRSLSGLIAMVGAISIGVRVAFKNPLNIFKLGAVLEAYHLLA